MANRYNSTIHKGSPRYMGSLSNQFSCYIENKNIPAGSKGRRIPLLFSPSSISDGISASFNQESIPGGSAPVITYSSTGARTVSIDFFVPIDYLPPNTDFNNTEEYLNALRALCYPEYSGTTVIPPNCILHLTNITLDGVCTQCNINYKTDKFGSDGALGADVSLSFTEVLNRALSSKEVSGRTTILSGTNVGFIEEQTLTNGTHFDRETTFDWTSFKLKGDAVIDTKLYIAIHNTPVENSLCVPFYLDDGFTINSGNTGITKFYYASNEPLSFDGNNIKGESSSGKSSVYKIVIGDDTYYTSTKVLQRNKIPEIKLSEARESGGYVYYYYIYVPYENLFEYHFDRAKIRTVNCTGIINDNVGEGD